MGTRKSVYLCTRYSKESMKRLLSLLAAVVAANTLLFAQGAKNIKVNEVLTDNQTSLQDEFGNHLPWVELANTSYTSYDVRGMFITTDRSVLNPSLTAPQRIARMSIIPNEEDRTRMSAREHLVLFLNSNPARGALHLKAPVVPGKPLWIALYDGNGIDLIDSVSVPALATDKSYARIKDGNLQWDVKPAEAVTPGRGNFIEINETKITRLKRDDPHGFGITILSMGIVFFCLFLLYVFFTILGKIMAKKQKTQAALEKEKHWQKFSKPKKTAEDKPRDPSLEEYMVIIAMALKEYQDNTHDEESGIITIQPHSSRWHNGMNQGGSNVGPQQGGHSHQPIPTGHNI